MSLLLLFRPRYGTGATPDTHDPGYYHVWRESDFKRYQDQLKRRYNVPKPLKKQRKRKVESTVESKPIPVPTLSFEQLQEIAERLAVRSESPIQLSHVVEKLEALISKLEADRLRSQRQLLIDLAIIAEFERRARVKAHMNNMLMLLLLIDE